MVGLHRFCAPLQSTLGSLTGVGTHLFNVLSHFSVVNHLRKSWWKFGIIEEQIKHYKYKWSIYPCQLWMAQLGSEGRGTYGQRKVGRNRIAAQTQAEMLYFWRALPLTAIIQCSHTSEANFLLVISPIHPEWADSHKSWWFRFSQSVFCQQDNSSGPMKCRFHAWGSIYCWTIMGKRTSIPTLETKHNLLKDAKDTYV